MKHALTVAALIEAGIVAKHAHPGTQRLACPRCAEVKHRARDDALALTIEPDGGTVWICHRCGFKGGTSGNEWRDDYVRERARIEGPRYQKQHAEAIKQADAKLNAKLAKDEDAAARARAIWQAAAPAVAHHPYLVRKRLAPDGLRQAERFQRQQHALLVPMRDASGPIINVQGIDAEGAKRFLAGARTRGAFALVGRWQRGHMPEALAIGEGWATVAAFVQLYPAFHGVAAMSAGNLLAVAEAMRAKFPVAQIVLLADRDPAGIRAAGAAAACVAGEVRFPGFGARGVNDWADVVLLERDDDDEA